MAVRAADAMKGRVYTLPCTEVLSTEGRFAAESRTVGTVSDWASIWAGVKTAEAIAAIPPNASDFTQVNRGIMTDLQLTLENRGELPDAQPRSSHGSRQVAAQ